MKPADSICVAAISADKAEVVVCGRPARKVKLVAADGRHVDVTLCVGHREIVDVGADQAFVENLR